MPTASRTPASPASITSGSGWVISAPRSSTVTGMGPPAVSWVHRPVPITQAVPRVGWPAKGSSIPGVKIRIE
jgi:hypothetical protein